MSIRNLLTEARFDHSRRALVAASILSADFAELASDSRAALDAGADLLHLDVMDGHFVTNLTMGPALCQSLHRALPSVCLDVHLMVTDPAMFVRPFAQAGASNFTFHIEAVPDPRHLCEQIHREGMSAGLALNPPTGVERILPFVEFFDLILIMSVNPGFSGQSFMPEVLQKARAVKPRLRQNQRLEIDGGVGSKTAPSCIEAGCDVLVAASAIFGAADYRQAIAEISGRKRAASEPTNQSRRADAHGVEQLNQ
jgi:ribulose-phosphate 3-epimerase